MVATSDDDFGDNLCPDDDKDPGNDNNDSDDAPQWPTLHADNNNLNGNAWALRIIIWCCMY